MPSNENARNIVKITIAVIPSRDLKDREVKVS
jgi:hypothetical protein